MMQWLSIKEYKPPMEVLCLIFTENNYYYLGRLIDADNLDVWCVDYESEEHGSYTQATYGVTHFCIMDAVKNND